VVAGEGYRELPVEHSQKTTILMPSPQGQLNLAQDAVLRWHALGKGLAGTTETLETWSWVRGDLGILSPGGLGDLSPVNFSRPYGTFSLLESLPGTGWGFIPGGVHRQRCGSSEKPSPLPWTGAPCSPQRTWPKKMGAAPFQRSATRVSLRPRAKVLARGVKAFEESVFGPGTLWRTWGTRPEPKTEVGGSRLHQSPRKILTKGTASFAP
jgi:hypothetical protein